MVSRELHLWDLQTQTLLATYDGFAQDRFVIGACLGGEEDGLVFSGSSSGHVHIWNKRSAKMITSRKGQSKTQSTQYTSLRCWKGRDTHTAPFSHYQALHRQSAVVDLFGC